jgi:hypothetical protein
VSSAFNEAKRSPTAQRRRWPEWVLLVGAQREPDLAYGHTGPGQWAAKRRKLTLEADKPAYCSGRPPMLGFRMAMFTCFWAHCAVTYGTCLTFLLLYPPVDKTRLSRGSELRPFYMGTWDRGSQWCNRLRLGSLAILGGRFLFWDLVGASPLPAPIGSSHQQDRGKASFSGGCI